MVKRLVRQLLLFAVCVILDCHCDLRKISKMQMLMYCLIFFPIFNILSTINFTLRLHSNKPKRITKP